MFDYYLAHGISTDPAEAFEQGVLFVFNLFIILISVFVVQSAYKSHLRRFSPEVGTLVSCGASPRQIRTVFIVEYLMVFSLAAISSLLISVGVMKLLFRFFLEIKDVSGLAWLIFHMNPVNTALHLLIYFISSAAVLGTTLWQYGRKSTGTLLHNDTLSCKTVRSKPITITSPPTVALSRLWRSRTDGSLYNCLLISVPIMTVFLFLFNYQMLGIERATAAPEYELQMVRDVYQFEEISEEDIACVEGLEGVRQVQPQWEYILDESGITGSEVVDRLLISLDDPAMHDRIKDVLQERFSGAGCRIVDHQEPVEYMQQISGGIYILMAYVFGILFSFALIILYIKISDYIEGCRNIIRSLYVIGASRQDLYYSYMRQIFPVALIASVIPIVISVILLVLVALSINVPAWINGAAVLVYCGSGACLRFLLISRTLRTEKHYAKIVKSDTFSHLPGRAEGSLGGIYGHCCSRRSDKNL